MPTQVEEQQAREFLKRAEIRTMKKDLAALREVDALKERDKIARIKTLEEQLDEQKAKQEMERAKVQVEKIAREEVLEKNEKQERVAEKDLKNYATEQERQQLFLLESKRFEFENEVALIDKEKDPALKLKKNELMLKVRDWQEKLDAILENEKKLEDEQKFLIEKSQASTIPEEKKSLESSRWDLDKKIQDVEKKRWDVEKQMETINNQISQIDKESELLVSQKNDLRNKILGIDKSTREIYSAVLAREEERRRGELEEQRSQREAVAQVKANRNEDVRRQQWAGVPVKKVQVKEDIDVQNKPRPLREKRIDAEKEQQERKKFLQNVESWAETGGQAKEKEKLKAMEGSAVERAKGEALKAPVIPPPPHKN